MSDNLSWNVYDSLDDQLREGFSGSEARLTTKVTYWFIVDPVGNPLLDEIKAFLPAFLRNVERFGVDDITGVLVQVLRGNVWVLLCKAPTIVADEFYLWGICVGHWDGEIEGGFLCGFGGESDPQTLGLYIVHPDPRAQISPLFFSWDRLTIQRR